MKKTLLFLVFCLVSGTRASPQIQFPDSLPFEWTMITSLVNANRMIGEARKTEDYLYVGLCKKYLDFAQSQLDYLKQRKEIDSNLANRFHEAINDLRKINSKATRVDLATSVLHRDINYKIFNLAKIFFDRNSQR